MSVRSHSIRSDTKRKLGGRAIVVGSSKTFSGQSTESLGLLTDALATISLR